MLYTPLTHVHTTHTLSFINHTYHTHTIIILYHTFITPITHTIYNHHLCMITFITHTFPHTSKHNDLTLTFYNYIYQTITTNYYNTMFINTPTHITLHITFHMNTHHHTNTWQPSHTISTTTTLHQPHITINTQPPYTPYLHPTHHTTCSNTV